MLSNISGMTLIWFILMVVFVVLEVGTYQLVSVWFALGAIASLLVSLFHTSPIVQFVVFVVVSGVALVASRPLCKKLQSAPKEKTNADRVIGQTAKVISPVAFHVKGRVELEGLTWAAEAQQEGDSFSPGDYVVVKRIEGVTVYVEKGERLS